MYSSMALKVGDPCTYRHQYQNVMGSEPQDPHRIAATMLVWLAAKARGTVPLLISTSRPTEPIVCVGRTLCNYRDQEKIVHVRYN